MNEQSKLVNNATQAKLFHVRLLRFAFQYICISKAMPKKC